MFNAWMKWLLRSRWHRLVSGSFMLVQYVGSKSGKTFCVPVNYLRQDNALLVISLRQRTWWRSLRHKAAILRLNGQDVPARASVLEDERQVAEALLAAVRLSPGYRRFLNISLDPAGQPRFEDALRAAKTRLVVRFHPQQE